MNPFLLWQVEAHPAPRRAALTRQSQGFDEPPPEVVFVLQRALARGSSTGCNKLLRLAFDKPLLADSVDLRGSWDETTMPRMAV